VPLHWDIIWYHTLHITEEGCGRWAPPEKIFNTSYYSNIFPFVSIDRKLIKERFKITDIYFAQIVIESHLQIYAFP
jgi:hypothetical protein